MNGVGIMASLTAICCSDSFCGGNEPMTILYDHVICNIWNGLSKLEDIDHDLLNKLSFVLM